MSKKPVKKNIEDLSLKEWVVGIFMLYNICLFGVMIPTQALMDAQYIGVLNWYIFTFLCSLIAMCLLAAMGKVDKWLSKEKEQSIIDKESRRQFVEHIKLTMDAEKVKAL